MKKVFIFFLCLLVFSCDLFFNPFLKSEFSDSSPVIRIVSPAGSKIFLPSDGLIAYYPFNGNANEESGNSNDGIVHGAVLDTDRFGNGASAYRFDGINDYIDIGNHAVFNLSSQITISAWVKGTSFNSVITKWKTESGWQGSWSMGVTGSGTPYFSATSDGVTGGYTASSALSIEKEKFYHIVGLYNSSDNIIRIFVNGVLQGTRTGQSGSLAVSNSKILIGAHIYDITSGHKEGHFGGVIDDICIYNRALSECEIKHLYYHKRDLTFSEADLIDFSCISDDTEDGELSGDSIIWTSSIDGKIGEGKVFSRALSVGDHTITAVATDSSSKVSSSSIDIKVVCAP